MPRHSFYNTKQWKNIRKQILARDPICAKGCGRDSTDVDHIDGDITNNADDNLQGLCHTCHSVKTVRENKGFGNEPGSSRPGPGHNEEGLPVDQDHPWNC